MCVQGECGLASGVRPRLTNTDVQPQTHLSDRESPGRRRRGSGGGGGTRARRGRRRRGGASSRGRSSALACPQNNPAAVVAPSPRPTQSASRTGCFAGCRSCRPQTCTRPQARGPWTGLMDRALVDRPEGGGASEARKALAGARCVCLRAWRGTLQMLLRQLGIFELGNSASENGNAMRGGLYTTQTCARNLTTAYKRLTRMNKKDGCDLIV